MIIHRTLTTLGLTPDLIDVHLLSKGSTVHKESERRVMTEKDPKYIIVLDQGGRRGPPIIDSAGTKSLVIDHHVSDAFPERAMVIKLCIRAGPS